MLSTIHPSDAGFIALPEQSIGLGMVQVWHSMRYLEIHNNTEPEFPSVSITFASNCHFSLFLTRNSQPLLLQAEVKAFECSQKGVLTPSPKSPQNLHPNSSPPMYLFWRTFSPRFLPADLGYVQVPVWREVRKDRVWGQILWPVVPVEEGGRIINWLKASHEQTRNKIIRKGHV